MLCSLVSYTARPCILDGPTEFLVESFGVLRITQKQDGGLAERPLELGVADLVVAAAGALGEGGVVVLSVAELWRSSY